MSVMVVWMRESIHMRKFPWHDQSIVTNQCSTCCQNSLFSVRSQWQFGSASMPSIQRPFGFSMTDNEHSGGRHPGQLLLSTPQLGSTPLCADSERSELVICVVESEKLVAPRARAGGVVLYFGQGGPLNVTTGMWLSHRGWRQG